MTDAYIQGFCKTAEAYGVDPEQLIKYAADPTRAANAAVSLARAFGKIPSGMSNRTAALLTDFGHKFKLPKSDFRRLFSGNGGVVRFNNPITIPKPTAEELARLM